jgi:hypothetical protein
MASVKVGGQSVDFGKGNLLAPSVNGNPWYDPAGLFGGKGDKNNVAAKNAQWDASPLPAFSGSSAMDPTNGETPITDLPGYGGAGGSQQAGQYYAAQDFKSMFGRNPTASELATLAPGYMSGDPNIANQTGGRQGVAAYFQQQSNSPQNVYKNQQAQYLAAAPKYADQVNQIFQSNLGRAATADEKTHFGASIASGQDPYQVQQALQQTQEYQNTQNANFQNKLQGQLQGSNSTYFNQYIAPDIAAQNAQAGRTQDSSGYQAQLANAALQQNQGLQTYLAGVTAQNYQNSTANAQNQYQGLMSQQYGLQNAGVSNTLANQAGNTQYQRNMDMYRQQQQSYSDYLNSYGKTNRNQNILTGAAGGASAGAAFGPWGAAIGGVGGGLLGAFSSGGSYI